jgi:probable HAF family extracellular repeat protein
MRRSVVFMAVLAAVLHATCASAATRYAFTRLGTFGGTPTSGSGSSYAYGINDAGQVAGFATAPGSVSTEACVWESGAITGLGTLLGPASGAVQSYAFAINDAGVVVGQSNGPGGASQAFSWQSGTMSGLGFLGSGASGAQSSYAYGINDAGVVVGTSLTGGVRQAFRYDGTMSAIGGLTGTSSAEAINTGGDVAGYAAGQAFILTSSGVAWLGSLGPSPSGFALSYAYGINDLQEVVGRSTSVASEYAAFIWSAAGGMRSLGDLAGGASNSIAYAVNDSGVAVGTSYGAAGQEAFVWDAAQGMVSLNTIVDGASGWVLREARGINAGGQIVGYGRNPAGGAEAFLLTPVSPDTPVIACDPSSFTFTAAAGGANPPDQALSVSNASGGTLDWSVSTAAAWLAFDPASGQQAGTVTLSVDTAGLAVGTYTTSLRIDGNAVNSPQSIPVSLHVVAPAPAIGFTPDSLSWDITAGSTGKRVQQLGITNAGDGTMGWFATGNQAWISVTPMSGGVASGVFTYADVGVNPTGKAPGAYTGTISISAYGATNTPQHVPVTMNILPAIAVTYPNGGEVLGARQEVVVTWDVSAPQRPVAKTVVSYSIDGGATWRLIRALPGLASSCAWTVPALTRTRANCRVRVRFLGASGAVLGKDRSDYPFTITKR